MRRPTPTFDPRHPTPELLIRAYESGIFPMADPVTGQIDWFSPEQRGIIPLDGFTVPRNLARLVRQSRFQIRSDTAFSRVMRECGVRTDPLNPSWISDELVEAYTGLFERGAAHSVEAWLGDDLVGGLYGVHRGAAFFGESMFSRPQSGGANASKVCLVHLVDHLRRQGFTLLDTQFWNEHLDQFGCIEIPRREYLQRLADALKRAAPWSD